MTRPPSGRSTRVRPVPGVTWLSHLGCGALLGFAGGLLGFLADGADPDTALVGGLAGAVVTGLVAALLGNRFWLR